MLICLITLDCVRADHMGGDLTPHMNALSPEWTVFSEAFAQSQNTLSSHLSMLTSNYLFQHGVYSNFSRKQLPEHALSRRLAERDWDCRAFTSVDFLAQLLGNQVGKEDPRFPPASDQSLITRMVRRLYGRRAPAEKTLDRGLKWLKSSQRKKDAFLWLHLFDAHMAYEAPQAYLKKHVKDGKAEMTLREAIDKKGWFSPDFSEYGQRLPLTHYPQRYRAAVAYQDACLHYFFAILKTMGVWDDALIVLTADHGECLMGDHSVYCAHKKLFDTTVKVPLRVKFPKGLHAGDEVDAMVQHVDIAPTAAALAGFSESMYMGMDLEAVASGRAPGHAVVFSEHVDNFMRAVRDRDLVYVEQVPGAENKWNLAMEDGALFDRRAAPAKDGDAAHARRLKKAMEDILAARPEVLASWGEAEGADEGVAERLKALGYM
jgi:arylsulfatase